MGTWTTRQRKIAVKMAEAGCTLDEIAERFGKQESAVRAYLNRCGIASHVQYKTHYYAAQLCWDCRKASGGEDCEWANRLQPVDGWTAEEIPARCTQAEGPWYKITACPKFAEG